MKKLYVLTLISTVLFYSSVAAAECPKASVLKMRVAKMKSIEKLIGYEIEAAEKLTDGGLKLAVGECQSNEHALMLLQLKGIARFSLKDFKAARDAFRRLYALKIDFALNPKLANPRLTKYYGAWLAEYKAELKKKAETKAKIKKLEDAVGMPPEPKENPKVPLEHKPRAKGLRGRKITIFCRVQDEIKATKVSAFVKAADGTYKPLDMKKVGVRRYVLTLSGKQTSTPILNYYLMAFNAADKPVAASGNSATPHGVEMVIAEEKDTTEQGTKKDPVKGPAKDPKKDPKKDPGKSVNQVEDDDPTEKVDPTKEDPDEIKKAAKVVDVKAWDAGPAPLFQLSVSAGLGLGLISGKTEVKKDDLSGGFSTAMTLQFEVGYMKSRRDVYSAVVQLGFVAVTNTDAYMENRDNGNMYYFTKSMRNDLRGMLRYKNYSVPLDIPSLTSSLGMRWRWYWGLGLGYGTLRHQAPAEVTEGGNPVTYDDSHLSSGVMLNGFGGASFCFTSGCALAMKAEVGYTATISVEESNYAHFDFLLGFTGTF